MAKFLGHLYGGAAVSSVAAIGVYSVGWAGHEQTQMLFVTGVAGSLLPDIDSDRSKPVRGFFTILGVAIGFAASFSLVERFPVVELALIGGGVFLLVRYGVYEVFSRYTVHRGIWHSWLGVAFAGLAGANACFHVGECSAFASWLAGFFLGLGYLTHLCLDEIASVDLLGNRLKRSFGTALKPFSVSSPWASISMLAAVIALTIPAPDPRPLLEAALRPIPSAGLLEARLLGKGDWIDRLRVLLD